jgi:hypothetical protein
MNVSREDEAVFVDVYENVRRPPRLRVPAEVARSHVVVVRRVFDADLCERGFGGPSGSRRARSAALRQACIDVPRSDVRVDGVPIANARSLAPWMVPYATQASLGLAVEWLAPLGVVAERQPSTLLKVRFASTPHRRVVVRKALRILPDETPVQVVVVVAFDHVDVFCRFWDR